jgi:hypothetical protein
VCLRLIKSLTHGSEMNMATQALFDRVGTESSADIAEINTATCEQNSCDTVSIS